MASNRVPLIVPCHRVPGRTVDWVVSQPPGGIDLSQAGCSSLRVSSSGSRSRAGTNSEGDTRLRAAQGRLVPPRVDRLRCRDGPHAINKVSRQAASCLNSTESGRLDRASLEWSSPTLLPGGQKGSTSADYAKRGPRRTPLLRNRSACHLARVRVVVAHCGGSGSSRGLPLKAGLCCGATPIDFPASAGREHGRGDRAVRA